jgi:hypothetical protein
LFVAGNFVADRVTIFPTAAAPQLLRRKIFAERGCLTQSKDVVENTFVS